MDEQVCCVKVRLNPNSIPRVREWASTLLSRKSEVLETLRAEGVTMETVFLEQHQDGDFLIYIMRAKDLELAGQIAQKSTLAIDEYHRAFKRETWHSKEELELLVNFG